MRRLIERGDEALAASDITLWEIAMLIAKGRLDPGTDAGAFIDDVLTSRAVRVLPITPQIAVLAQSRALLHGDPADRIIAATALAHGAVLVTADAALRKLPVLETIW